MLPRNGPNAWLMARTGSGRQRSYENLVTLDAHFKNWKRTRRWPLFHLSSSTIEPRTVPRALDRSIGKDIAQRHLKVLMSAIVSYSGYAFTTPNEAHSLTV
jgi:hypothetical protein